MFAMSPQQCSIQSVPKQSEVNKVIHSNQGGKATLH